MIVSSSYLDGLTGHCANSAWIEASVERRVKPTGAGTHQLTARRVPGGARPGRSAAPQEADGRKHSLAVGRAAPDRRSVCHSQRIGGKDHQCAEGGLSGNPVRVERAERGRTPRVSAEGHAGRGGDASGLPNLQDRARRRVSVWRTTALGAGRPAKGAAFALRKIRSSWPRISKQLRTAEFQLVDERVHDKHVCRKRRRKECERLGVSTVSL